MDEDRDQPDVPNAADAPKVYRAFSEGREDFERERWAQKDELLGPLEGAARFVIWIGLVVFLIFLGVMAILTRTPR